MAKQITKWEAKDGTVWDSQNEAINYEVGLRITQEIADHLETQHEFGNETALKLADVFMEDRKIASYLIEYYWHKYPELVKPFI